MYRESSMDSRKVSVHVDVYHYLLFIDYDIFYIAKWIKSESLKHRKE